MEFILSLFPIGVIVLAFIVIIQKMTIDNLKTEQELLEYRLYDNERDYIEMTIGNMERLRKLDTYKEMQDECERIENKGYKKLVALDEERYYTSTTKPNR